MNENFPFLLLLLITALAPEGAHYFPAVFDMLAGNTDSLNRAVAKLAPRSK
jgi:hypothetical protein